MSHVTVPRGAVERLQTLIRDERLRPGDGLPSQRDLATTLAISRASLREALSALETMGLVSVQPGRGVYVAEPAAAAPAWRFADRCTPRDVYETRYGLEGFAAGLAAERLDPADLAALGDSVAALEAACAAGDIGAMAAADCVFHDVIIAACGNPMLAAMYRSAREMMVESQKLPMFSRSKLQETAAEHRAILGALTTRDAAAARRLMQRHIRSAARRLGIAL